jgi:hypothetical protein
MIAVLVLARLAGHGCRPTLSYSMHFGENKDA